MHTHTLTQNKGINILEKNSATLQCHLYSPCPYSSPSKQNLSYEVFFGVWSAILPPLGGFCLPVP